MKEALMVTVCVVLSAMIPPMAFTEDVDILILIPNNYGTNYHLERDDFEFFGWNVTLAAVTEAVAPCPVYGGPLGAPALTVDVLISDITDITDYDIVAVVSGGGNDACADLLASQEALDLIAEAAQSGLVVSGFCPGVRVLAAADVIDGRYERDQAVSSGVYFFRMTAENYNSVRKMILLK